MPDRAPEAVAGNRNRGRRGRSRKRRAPAVSGGAGAAAQTRPPETPRERGATPAGKRPRAATRRGGGGFRDPMSTGARPQAPWHPWPLSELLILVGAIGTIVGLRRGVSHGGPALFAGLAAVMIGTLEVTWREHVSGYRSHTIMLALLPTIAFHTLLLVGLSLLTPVSSSLKVAPVVIDVPLFAFLFKVLRARYLDARRERRFAGGR
jgi:hypothetical protein